MRIGLDVPLARLLDDYDAQSERYRHLFVSWAGVAS
jgi:hypothetical protein